MEGYLTKRGRIFKTWRTRWFELSRENLRYYSNQSKRVFKGVYVLTEDTIVEIFDEFEGNKFMLRLLNEERELLLSAMNEEDQEKWLLAIRAEINNEKQQDNKKIIEKGGRFRLGSFSSGRFSIFGFGKNMNSSVSTDANQMSRHVTNTSVCMEGFLMKRARGVLMRSLQNWKARWFVLSEDIVTNLDDNSVVSSRYKLTYYKDAYNQKDGPSGEKGCFVFDKHTKLESLVESGEFRHIIVLSRGGDAVSAEGRGRFRSNSFSSLSGLSGLGSLGLGDASSTNPSNALQGSEEKGDGRQIILSAVDSDTENKWLDALSKVIRKAYLAETSQNTSEDSAVGVGRQSSVDAGTRTKRMSIGRGKTSRRLRVDGPTGVSNVPKMSPYFTPAENSNKWDEDSEDDESVCGDEVETPSRNPVPTNTDAGCGGVSLPKGWVEVKNGSVVYYYHTKARVSRWDVPTPEAAAELEVRLEEAEKRAMDAAKKRKEELAMKKAAKEEKERLAAEMKDQIVAKCDAWRHYPGTSNIRSLPELLIDLHDLFPSIVSRDVLVPECEEEARAVKKMYMKVIRLLHPDKLSNKLDLETRLLADAVYRQLSDVYMVYRKAFAEI